MNTGHRTIRATLLAALSTIALAACGPTAEPEASAPETEAATAASVDYAAIVADSSRPAEDKADDADRKPIEMLEFAGVEPGMSVFEMLPGGGYFSRLFTPTVGADGKVVLYVADELVDKPFKPLDGAEKLATELGDTVTVTHFPLAGPVPEGMEEAFDVVWTSRNYHDFHNIEGFDAKASNAMVLDLLKPGGVYVLLDHSAPEGSGAASTSTTHRIDADLVRGEVESAGFLYDGASPVLANPDDPRDISIRDKSIRGHTDQFVLRFRKPG